MKTTADIVQLCVCLLLLTASWNLHTHTHCNPLLCLGEKLLHPHLQQILNYFCPRTYCISQHGQEINGREIQDINKYKKNIRGVKKNPPKQTKMKEITENNVIKIDILHNNNYNIIINLIHIICQIIRIK